jgi:nucleolar pre-ribosomal-associated protein 1
MLRLQTSTFPEAVTTYLLLGELVETAQIVSLDSPQPLPYLVTTFASRAVAVLSDPTHAMYPKLAGFLTLRPNWSPLRLVRHLLELVLLQEPSEASDAAHWREVIWLLDWLHDGLRSPADGDILRQVGSWEALGAFGAHPSLGASSARADGEELGAQRLQSRVRGLIVRTLGRALCVGQAATLATRAGGVVWLEIWQAMGWVEDGMAVALREGIVRGGGERVKEWSFGVMDDG